MDADLHGKGVLDQVLEEGLVAVLGAEEGDALLGKGGGQDCGLV